MTRNSPAWEATRWGGFRRTGIVKRHHGARSKRNLLVRLQGPVQIRWAEQLGLPDCPYVIRWRLETPWGSVRVHHWLGPDDDRAHHDHPWWFVTVVLRGGYTDHTPTGPEHLRAGMVRYRPALHRHTVVPDPGGAWTLLVTGPKVRPWGFWPRDGKFIKANKWFLTRGHHPCE